MTRFLKSAAALLAVFSANSAFADTKIVKFDFDQANLAWGMGYADYPKIRDSDWGFITGYTTLPSEVDNNARRGLYLAGSNHSDDLFMFATGAMFDLEPGKEYLVTATFTIATNAPNGCVGIGGSVGNSVYVKFGATTAQPRSLIEDDRYLRMNIDKGNQASSGANAIVVGDIAGTNTDCHSTSYELKTFDTGKAGVVAEANNDGSIWLIVGSDSGFEGQSAWYLVDLEATATPK